MKKEKQYLLIMFRNLLSSITLFLLLFTYSFAGEVLTGKIVKVADGDTVTILTPNNQQVKIRLNCIDAPEKNQDFGQKAKQSLGNLIFGKIVEVEKHDIDRYGRTIGTIYLNDLNINLIQVEKGFAWVYREYCKDNIYYNAERKARSMKTGLWSHPNPIPPWDYRRVR